MNIYNSIYCDGEFQTLIAVWQHPSCTRNFYSIDRNFSMCANNISVTVFAFFIRLCTYVNYYTCLLCIVIGVAYAHVFYIIFEDKKCLCKRIKFETSSLKYLVPWKKISYLLKYRSSNIIFSYKHRISLYILNTYSFRNYRSAFLYHNEKVQFRLITDIKYASIFVHSRNFFHVKIQRTKK